MDNTAKIKLKEILDYEEKISQINRKIQDKDSKPFTKPNKKITHEKVVRKYPDVKSQMTPDYKKWCIPLIAAFVISIVLKVLGSIFLTSFIGIVLTTLGSLVGIVVPLSLIYIAYQRFVVFPKEKKADEECIRNSSEYKEQCRKLDEEYDRQQQELDKKYNAALEKFNQEVAEWESKNEEWNKKVEAEINELKIQRTSLENERDILYSEVKSIPVNYRKKKIVKFIYQTISTSDYSIKEAIELYERNEQNRIEQEKLNGLKAKNDLARKQLELQREREMREEYYAEVHSSSHSSGESFLGNMLSTAGGVALGNKMSGKTQNRSGKKDLYGTAVCQRCRASHTSMEHHTCAGCPASRGCTKQIPH